MQRLLTTVGLGFVLYALASLAWAPAINWLAVVGLFFSIGAFLVGLSDIDHRRVWLWFVCGVAALIPAYILFPAINPNYAGAAIALAVGVALTYNWWLYLPFGAIGLAFAGSRGSIAAAGVVTFLALLRRFPTIGFTVLAGAIILIILEHPTYDSLYQRLGIWQDTFDHLTIFGSGFGSFQAAYTSWPVHRNMTNLIAPHAYNDYLELLSDLGIGAAFLVAFVALCLSADGPKLPALTFILLGLTYFPFSIPIIAQTFAFALGQLARRLQNGSLENYCQALPQRRRHDLSA